jgi:hypothetical protein
MFEGYRLELAMSVRDELIVCGADEVFVLDLGRGGEKVWSWRAEGQSSLPESMWEKFGSVDECKPVDKGKRILLTSSGSGVAVVERETGEAEFYATVVNAHSVDLLPNDRFAVAASHVDDGPGDRLIVFDLGRSEVEVCSEELPKGHGVVWDDARGVVWALAHEDIRVFELVDWDSDLPSLRLREAIALPEGGGHELSVLGDTDFLAVSTYPHCYLFDRETHAFTLHPDLGDEMHVKCISHHPESERVAYVQGEGGHWWAERVGLLHPEEEVHLPGERVYKVRWDVG